jgi:hypothetical protein
MFAGSLSRTFDGVDLTDPVAAAKDRPAFELRSTP